MVKMAGSNQGASSAYTEAGPPEMMIALRPREETAMMFLTRGVALCDG